MSSLQLPISNLTFTPSGSKARSNGLLGFVSLTYGEVQLDGLALRRTAAGRLTFSYPERRDRLGGRHPIVRPRSENARLELERTLLAALGMASEGLDGSV